MISEKVALRILKTAQFIGGISRCMDIEVTKDLTDARFKHPTLNNHNRRIKEGIKGISNYIGTIVQVKNRDEFDYDYSVELHRVITHFCGLTTEQLREFMDRVDEELDKNRK